MQLHAKMREIVLFAGVPEKSYDTLLKFSDCESVIKFLEEVYKEHYKPIKDYIDDFPIEYWNHLDQTFGERVTDEQKILFREKKNLRIFWRDNIKDVKSNAKQDLARKNTERLQNRPTKTRPTPGDS